MALTGIVEELNEYQFMDRFRSSSYKDNFSYEGLYALYDYLYQYSEDLGEPYEFDLVGIACDYTEYDDLKELQGTYWDIKDMDDLRAHTSVIEIFGTDRFIIQDF
jgi:hypothetical protein